MFDPIEHSERDKKIETSEKKKKIEKKLIAKKDHEIHCNDYHRIIKEGDDVSDVPEMYLVGLRTEKVL